MTRVIDAHHHVLHPERAAYPWMTPEVDLLRRPFPLGELQPDLEAAGVDGTVVVQARTSLDETRELLELAATSPLVLGVVGWADLADRALSDVLAELRAGTGGDRLVAIRHPVHDEPDAEWLLRPAVRRGIATVGEAGLAFDLLVRPREMPAALDIVRSEPGVRFVIDHLAKPEIASHELEPWATLLADFAALPNTWCKLSGLVTEADWATWTLDDLRPYVDRALEDFGPSRLMYGSDWPVCLLAGSYPTVIATARSLTEGLSGDERAAVFGGAAEDVYRLAE
ncbi:MAG: amidohydrolase family protein [Chloroflexota bacterium]